MAQTHNFALISPADAGGTQEKNLLARARDALPEAGFEFEREAAGRYVEWMLRHILVAANGDGGHYGVVGW